MNFKGEPATGIDYPNVLIMSPASSHEISMNGIRKTKIMRSSIVENVGLSCSYRENPPQ